jgi:hypothetical protein
VIVLPAVLMLVRPRSSPKLPRIEWDAATVAANGTSNGANGANGGNTPGASRLDVGP